MDLICCRRGKWCNVATWRFLIGQCHVAENAIGGNRSNVEIWKSIEQVPSHRESESSYFYLDLTTKHTQGKVQRKSERIFRNSNSRVFGEGKGNGRTKANPVRAAPFLLRCFIFLPAALRFRWCWRRGTYCRFFILVLDWISVFLIWGSDLLMRLCRLDLLRVVRRGFRRPLDCIRQGWLQR